MQEYVDRLQALLAKSELTPAEVKEGIVSTYVIISRLNQTDGNYDVGLKQDAEGLFSHIDGFMGAVFWERGFDSNNPTLEQVAETKIMMDGMTQIYAMPENIQSAFNDIYEYLSNKAKGMEASLTAETKELLKLDDSAAAPETSSADTPSSAEVAQTREVDQIISELPSEMESNWDMAPPPIYPTAEPAETLPAEEPPVEVSPVMPDSKTPEIPEVEVVDSEPTRTETPSVIPDSETTEIPSAETSSSVEKFDPSKVLEEETVAVSESESPSVEEEPPTAEEFDPSKILEEEPSVVTEEDAIPEDVDEQVTPGFENSTIESAEPVMSSNPDEPTVPEIPTENILKEEPKPAETTGEAWNYEVLSTPEVLPLTGESTEVEVSAAETAEETPKKRRGRKKKVKKVVKKKAKKRGRPRKKVVDVKDKPKRKRNIKAKNLKIDLSALNIPDDYMAKDPFAPAYTEESEQQTSIPTDVPPIGEPENLGMKEPDTLTAAVSESDLIADETAFEDDDRQEIGEFEPETSTPVFEAEVPTALELGGLGVETPTGKESESFELPDTDAIPESISEEIPGTEEPSIDVSGFAGLEDTPDLPDERKKDDLVDRQTSAELGAILEEEDEIPAIPDFGVPSAESVAETPEPVILEEETAMAESESSEEIQESEEPVSRDGASPGELEFPDDKSYAERLEEEPAPESSPSSWTELRNEPVEGETPMSKDIPAESYSEPDSGTKFEEIPVSNAEIASELPPKKSGSPLPAILALILGLALGGGASYYWFGVQQAKVMKDKIQTLEKQVEESKQAQEELAKVQTEVKVLSDVINGQTAASKLPVPKPRYYKVGKGALVYWVDDSPMARKYYLYRAKGKKGELKKISDKPAAKNMLLFRKVSRGTWRYAVTAVDLEGNETELSETLSLKFPLKK